VCRPEGLYIHPPSYSRHQGSGASMGSRRPYVASLPPAEPPTSPALPSDQAHLGESCLLLKSP
jgi:hypothetical protein